MSDKATNMTLAEKAAYELGCQDTTNLLFDRLEQATASTAVYPDQGNNVLYPLLGLLGEAGEIANQAKKVVRDDNGIFLSARKNKIIDELGDVWWYWVMLCRELKVPIGTVIRQNITKLEKRKAEDTPKEDRRASTTEQP